MKEGRFSRRHSLWRNVCRSLSLSRSFSYRCDSLGCSVSAMAEGMHRTSVSVVAANVDR